MKKNEKRGQEPFTATSLLYFDDIISSKPHTPAVQSPLL